MPKITISNKSETKSVAVTINDYHDASQLMQILSRNDIPFTVSANSSKGEIENE